MSWGLFRNVSRDPNKNAVHIVKEVFNFRKSIKGYLYQFYKIVFVELSPNYCVPI